MAVKQQGSLGIGSDPYVSSSVSLAADGLPDRTVLGDDHFPRILRPAEAGTIRVIAEVVGEFQTVVFRLSQATRSLSYREELWSRSDTRAVEGRVISVFENIYPASILSDLLVYPHGQDNPHVPIGRLVVPDPANKEPETNVMLWLRLGDSDLPNSTVGTIVEEAG